jgi:flap endonuclease-1
VLCKAGKVSAVLSEDIDCLAFGAPRLIKGFPNNENICCEINFEIVLDCLCINYSNFVEMCVISGCDYSKGIKGVGIFKAYELIQEHNSLEKFISSYPSLFEDEMSLLEARELFYNPKTYDPNDIYLAWNTPKFDELIDFMCFSKGFNLDRVESAYNRLKVIFFL